MKKAIIIIGITFTVIAGIAGYFYVSMQNQSKNEDPLYWEKDIQKIESRYNEIVDTDIVFIGSSSIRKWEDLNDDFSEYVVVNHGFGGSKVADSTYFYDRLVTPFNPELIVLFSGTNDINGISSNSKSGSEVFKKEIDFKSFKLNE